MGPVCADLWRDQKHGRPAPPPADLSNGQLNTIGYVCSRYGANTGADLELLSHSEPPWRSADQRRRINYRDDLIDHESMRLFFAGNGAPGVGDGVPSFDPEDVRALVEQARENLNRPAAEDRIEDLYARLSRG